MTHAAANTHDTDALRKQAFHAAELRRVGLAPAEGSVAALLKRSKSCVVMRRVCLAERAAREPVPERTTAGCVCFLDVILLRAHAFVSRAVCVSCAFVR